jgi:hypothetical protein
VELCQSCTKPDRSIIAGNRPASSKFHDAASRRVLQNISIAALVLTY